MRKIIISLGIILGVASLGIMYYIYQPVVMSVGSITTIQGTDKMSDSRTTINDNFSYLDNNKMGSGTTTIPTLTTASNLVTVGALSSGSLTTGFTVINVAQGGTGASTLLSNQVLLGNGTSAIDKVSGFGTSGQFLTSNGNGVAPTWQTSSVNQGDNYTWTGEHIFTASSSMLSLNLTDILATTATTTNLIATTGSITNLTSSGTQTLNGIEYTFPSTEGASSTVLSTNGSGGLVWLEEVTFRLTASDTLQASANTERASSELPAGSEEFMNKRIAVRYSGTVRVTYDAKASQNDGRFELRDETGGVLATGSSISSSYVAKSHDVYVEAGTNIKLHFKSSTSNTVGTVQNFRVKFTKSITTDVVVITN